MSIAKLSKLQKDILTTVAARPGTGRPLHAGSHSPARADVMMRDILGEKPTPTDRAALSRAASRLVKRGLIEVWHWPISTETGISLTDGGRQTVNKVTCGNLDNRFDK